MSVTMIEKKQQTNLHKTLEVIKIFDVFEKNASKFVFAVENILYHGVWLYLAFIKLGLHRKGTFFSALFF